MKARGVKPEEILRRTETAQRLQSGGNGAELKASADRMHNRKASQRRDAILKRFPPSKHSRPLSNHSGHEYAERSIAPIDVRPVNAMAASSSVRKISTT